jgi:hypothetical protein
MVLGRLFGKRPQWPPEGPILVWPRDEFDGELRAVKFESDGRHVVDAVGEGSYQGSLERIAGGRTIDGARVRDHLAVLLPEPDNPYDANAVRVAVVPSGTGGAGGYVGYLSRENAVAYRPLIDRLAEIGKVVACAASLSGGWDRGGGDQGSFGVRRHIAEPGAAMAELERDSDNLRPAWE